MKQILRLRGEKISTQRNLRYKASTEGVAAGFNFGSGGAAMAMLSTYFAAPHCIT
jgi:hypothetical protein